MDEITDLLYNKENKHSDFLELSLKNDIDKSISKELKIKIKLSDKTKEKPEIFDWKYSINDELESEKEDKDIFQGILKSEFPHYLI